MESVGGGLVLAQAPRRLAGSMLLAVYYDEMLEATH